MSLTEPLHKKAKKLIFSKTMPINSSPKTDMKSNKKMEYAISLTGKKKIAVQEYKGMILIHIREYYEINGQSLPGKKGIALNTADWKLLKENLSDIDGQLANY